MPKVSIREIDNTGAETLEYLNYTVLIPGPKLKGEKRSTGEKFDALQGLFTKASQITTDIVFDTSTPKGYKTELGYLMACELLSKGLSVYFFPAYTISEQTEGTTTKIVKKINSAVGETDAEALTRMFKEFSDKGKYDLRFITIGGIDESISDAVFNKATLEAWRCAGDRGDAVAILNTPASVSAKIGFYSVYVNRSGEEPQYSHDPAEGFVLEYVSLSAYENLPDAGKEACSSWTSFLTYKKTVEGVDYYSKASAEGYVKTILTFDDYSNLASENQVKCTPQNENSGALDSGKTIDTWVNSTFSSFADSTIERSGVSWSAQERTTETYGRYAAMFTPQVNMTLYIDGKNTSVIVPASFDYLACFAKHIQRYKSWFAMSGSVRGVSPYANITPTVVFGDADINNILQIRTSDTEGHLATNAICEIRPYGNIVWGNRTMHPLKKPDNAQAESSIQLTASSFLNIRQLCCDIKKTLYRSARRFTFEPNSDALWYNFKATITPLLDEMKSNQGIKGYQVIKLKTSKKALLVAKIKIVPIEAVEDFDLTVELADSIEVTE